MGAKESAQEITEAQVFDLPHKGFKLADHPWLAADITVEDEIRYAQAAIQNSLQNSEYIISTTTSATERARETKKKDKYVKQLNELRPYYQALSHIALQRILMDLDDGVKKNYQLFQGVEVSTEGKKKQTINLLSKI